MKAFLLLLLQVISRPNRARANVFTLEQKIQQKMKGSETADDEPKNKFPGLSGGKRIINGQNARLGRYPYFASLENIEGNAFCGGSLIAPNVVLSAAHCAGYATHVTIGRQSRSQLAWEIERYTVLEEIQHELYWDEEYYAMYDFMLVLFDGISPTTPVSLNQNDAIPSVSDSLTVMGFGTTHHEYHVLPEYLQQVSVNYVPNNICATAETPFGDYPPYKGLIQSDMLCAAGQNKDSCSGDSGGPLIIPGATSELDVQVGVVSWGFSCAHPSYPGVYGRVSHVYDSWIQPTVCAMTLGIIEDSKRSGCADSILVSTPVPSASPTTVSPTLVPSTQITSSPTSSPTDSPTSSPTNSATTSSPTRVPTAVPSTASPTAPVTSAPTKSPTSVPTDSPTPPGTPSPTESPTLAPTPLVTPSPTNTPTPPPTPLVTAPPTDPVTAPPTPFVTSPSTEPPSPAPTRRPRTKRPSAATTTSPTTFLDAQIQTKFPSTSVYPSSLPTLAPSSLPSQLPSLSPSEAPSDSPSDSPSIRPTLAPSNEPTPAPSLSEPLLREFPESSGIRIQFRGSVAISIVGLVTGVIL